VNYWFSDGKPYEDLNFVVAHIGGGISVAAQRRGRIIDVNNANNEGPFSPERTGTLPAKQLVEVCYLGKFTEKEMLATITKLGGVYSYFGTKNMMEVEERVLNGDEKAVLVLNAMIHQDRKRNRCDGFCP
jgi:butyrate kinase